MRVCFGSALAKFFQLRLYDTLNICRPVIRIYVFDTRGEWCGGVRRDKFEPTLVLAYVVAVRTFVLVCFVVRIPDVLVATVVYVGTPDTRFQW